MNKLYPLLVLAIAFVGNAQIINIPDANLKAKLLSASYLTQTASVNYPNSSGTVSAGSYVVIDTNNDGEIQLSEAALIKVLKLNVCSLGTPFVDMTGIEDFTNLIYLNVNCNSIVNFNLNNPLLRYIECQNNNIQSADFSHLSDLREIRVTGSNLTTIDFSQNLLLTSAQLQSNTSLEYIFIKNTSIFMPVGSGVNPLNLTDDINLKYICAKESEVTKIKQYFSTSFFNGIFDDLEVNTYCSFNPGGIFYTIQGITKYDSNNNGCDVNDISIPFQKIYISSGSVTGSLISNMLGNYSIPVQSGTNTLIPLIENPTYFSVTPANISVTFPTETSPFAQDFCLMANGVHNDLEVTLLPISLTVPGFNTLYEIVYKNKGTSMQSGSVRLAFDDTKMDLISATPSNTNSSTNSLSWAFSNLQPFETREIIFTMNINSPMEIPAVNGGDILNYTASIIGLTDETPTDNTVILNQTVFNSYDPNDKTCIEGTTVSPSTVGQYVHYVIRFENTGTANAQNIVVKDIIDTVKYDVSSLVPLIGSASYVTRITNTNQVEFIFQNINLPFDDANNDGYVAFKIKTKPTLVVGDTFSNTANIYFDYNFPIVTNTAITTIATLGTQDFEFGRVFSISPVPAKNVLTITAKQAVVMSSVSIYNMLGQLVQVNTNPNETIDVSGLKTGTYFIKIVSDRGTASAKFIKK